MVRRQRIAETNRCSVCGSLGHNRSTCPVQRRHAPKHCRLCSGLPHRRQTIRVREDGEIVTDPTATHCEACGLPYAPETPLSIADVMRMPAEDRRIEHV